MKQVIFIGAGSHCKNILSFFRDQMEHKVYGITDPAKTEGIMGIPILGSDNMLATLYRDGLVQNAFVTVGSTGDNRLRAKLYHNAAVIGYDFINIIHPASVVASDIEQGRGNLVMAGCIINSGVRLGDNNILNTGSIIEHDVHIGSHVHIAPGAVIGGHVEIEDMVHIGIGATIIQGIKIGKGSVVGAGAVVVRDIPEGVLAFGVPAKVIKQIKEG